jgi:hypothetical protein
MKSVLDKSFRYRPSFDTDVRKTFERIRKAQKPKPAQEVVQLPRRKAHG